MIKYPYMRKELIVNLRALADSTYQERVWVRIEQPVANYEDNLDAVVHFIFDDMSLDTHLEQAIGDILCNDDEAQVVRDVVEKLNKVLNSRDMNATDEEYISSPHWPEVVRVAKKAYTFLTAGQQPEGMFEDIKNGWPSKKQFFC